ncbi:BON domain-containing protein [Pararhizobium arenae]|uniref:BON domain-containing protein n=1 Tax=Pararhizobium arenae TaxID=1856850 RepID=UPI00094AB1D3|nr:BON domain-containing protein [Pararhizobium arenae]
MDRAKRPTNRDLEETSRAEDYRDYEERDIDEGWPYADARSGSPVAIGNDAYGEAPENFDESGNPGYESGNDPRIESHGGPDLLKDKPAQDIDDDVLEQIIADRLEEADIDMSGFEIRIDGGVVSFEGEVDTAEDRRQAGILAQRVAGVKSVRNHLTLLAADANLPSDWDE